MPSPLRQALLLATLLSAIGGKAQAAEQVLTLKPSQVAALGVRVEVVTAGAEQSAARYLGTVVVPTGQQRVVAAPLPALIQQLQLSVGETVRAGQLLAVLHSAQGQELQHDAHVSRTQAVLASSVLARDEALFKEGLIALSRVEASRAQAGMALEQQEEREDALRRAGGSAKAAGGRLTLVAPISGVVLERPAVVGQRVDAAAVLYRIANVSSLWLELQVPAADVSKVQLGDSVRVANGAGGRVIAIGASIDAASQTVLVRARVDGAAGSLRAGEAVEVQLNRAAPGTVQLPAAAVLQGAGDSVVFVDAGAGRYRVAKVQWVGSVGALASVRGLPAGSKVVVQGTAALKAMLAAAQP